MKTRLVRPELFSDERLSGVGPYALPLLLGLPCMADRDGRLEDKPLQIKTLILPYAEIALEEFNSILNLLHNLRFILRYEVNGKRCIQILDFANEQKPHPKEACRNLPEIPEGFEELKEITGNSMKLNEISGNYLNTNSNSNNKSNSNTKEDTKPKKILEANPDKKPEPIEIIQLDPHVDTPEVREALNTWLAYKKEKNQAYKPIGLKTLYTKISKMGGAQFVLAVENSIQSNYSGLFAPSGGGQGSRETAQEKSQRILRENHERFSRMDTDPEAMAQVLSRIPFFGENL